MTTVASPHESSDLSSDARGVRRGQAPAGTRAQCQEADAACFLKETRQDAEPAFNLVSGIHRVFPCVLRCSDTLKPFLAGERRPRPRRASL